MSLTPRFVLFCSETEVCCYYEYYYCQSSK